MGAASLRRRRRRGKPSARARRRHAAGAACRARARPSPQRRRRQRRYRGTPEGTASRGLREGLTSIIFYIIVQMGLKIEKYYNKSQEENRKYHHRRARLGETKIRGAGGPTPLGRPPTP